MSVLVFGDQDDTKNQEGERKEGNHQNRAHEVGNYEEEEDEEEEAAGGNKRTNRRAEM